MSQRPVRLVSSKPDQCRSCEADGEYREAYWDLPEAKNTCLGLWWENSGEERVKRTRQQQRRVREQQHEKLADAVFKKDGAPKEPKREDEAVERSAPSQQRQETSAGRRWQSCNADWASNEKIQLGQLARRLAIAGRVRSHDGGILRDRLHRAGCGHAWQTCAAVVKASLTHHEKHDRRILLKERSAP